MSNSDGYPITLVNGKQQKLVSAADRGLAYGDGLFETLLVTDVHIPLWPYHHTRLLNGLVRLGINLESQRLRQDVDAMLSIIEERSSSLHILKIIATRGAAGRGYQSTDTESTLILSLYPYIPDDSKHNGVAAHICKHKLPVGVPWAGLKTLNQLSYVLAAQERMNLPCDEGLLFSTEDHLVEATARNLFIINGEKLYTPLLDQCGVKGVMREFIIEKILPQLGLQCEEKALLLSDLADADEVFLSNSISGIWPLLECDNMRWSVGPVTRSLQAMCHGFFGSTVE